VDKGWVWGLGGVIKVGLDSKVGKGFSGVYRGVNRMVKILAI